jgi:hypothetical protein
MSEPKKSKILTIRITPVRFRVLKRIAKRRGGWTVTQLLNEFVWEGIKRS